MIIRKDLLKYLHNIKGIWFYMGNNRIPAKLVVRSISNLCHSTDNDHIFTKIFVCQNEYSGADCGSDKAPFNYSYVFRENIMFDNKNEIFRFIKFEPKKKMIFVI